MGPLRYFFIVRTLAVVVCSLTASASTAENVEQAELLAALEASPHKIGFPLQTSHTERMVTKKSQVIIFPLYVYT